jgi:hypothetical protein
VGARVLPSAVPLAHLLLVLFGALLLVPSTDYGVFNGIPLSTLPEAVALAFLIPFAVSRGLRAAYRRLLRRLGPLARRGLVGLAVVALGLKLVLLAAGSHAGFLACYRSPAAAPAAGSCVRSYTNPFFRYGVTRLDRSIDFGPTDWNLVFVNSLHFHFLPWVPGNVRRDRLPLEARWTGVLARAQPAVAEIVYVGQATMRLGAAPIVELPPHYGQPATATVEIPAGRHEMTLTYRFDDGSRVGGAPPPGPYATLQMRVPTPEGPAALLAAGPARLERAASRLVDATVLLLVGPVLLLYARLLARDWWMLALVAAGGPLAYAYRVTLPGLPRGPGFLLLFGCLLGFLLARPRQRRLLVVYLSAGYLALFTAFRSFSRLDTVAYRPPGDDWFAYEALAYSLLETWSPAGGERVFFLQPLLRYVRFVSHLLFGDGDLLLLASSLTALNWALFWLMARLWRGPRPTRAGTVLFVGAGLLLLGLANSATVVTFVQAPLSEYPTWIFLPLLVPLLFCSDRTRDWLGGAALVGLTFLARANHAPALLAIWLIFLGRVYRRRPRPAILATALLLVMGLLPLAHNLYYGGRWVLVTSSTDLPANQPFPPSRWLAAVHDAETRGALWTHLRYLLYLTSSGEALLQPVIHGLQAAWILAIWLVARWWQRPWIRPPLLVVLPACYLGVHLVFATIIYFPRHLISGYLAMGVVALYAARAARSSSDGIPTPAALRATEASDPPAAIGLSGALRGPGGRRPRTAGGHGR